MDYSKISIKIKKSDYFELLQYEINEYAICLKRSVPSKGFYLNAIIKLEIISKLNFRFRDIIEKYKRPKSLSLSVQEASILILVNNYKVRATASLENIVLQSIADELIKVFRDRLS